MKKFNNNLEIAEYFINLAKKAYKKCSKNKIEVSDKGYMDLLTTLDTSIEKYVLNDFSKHFPNVKIVSEEFNTNIKPEGTYFVIDPIDGTVNFANGINQWGIQFAYIENDITVASAIYLPSSKEEFYAAKGFGAFKNGKKFYAKKKDPIHSLISIEVKDFDLLSNLYKELQDKILRFRQLGACSVHCARVAEGSLSAFAVLDTNPWDILPGFLLMEEAGCKRKTIYGKHIFATTTETLNIIYQAFEKHIVKKEKVKVKAARPTNSKDIIE